MASLESGAAITPASVFNAASISKQFTAMTILLLAERGKLSIDDDVRQYVPEWGEHGSRITIRHLLSHTSGLREGYVLTELAPPPKQGVERMDSIVRVLSHAQGLNFTPGTEFEYNNSAYTLLADIVKRVSGQSLRAFAEANIFRPLGMTHTHFHDDAAMVVPNRAWGYHRDSAGVLHMAIHEDLGHVIGNDGLFTTAADLLLWQRNFAQPRVGTPALVAAMQTPVIATGWSEGSSYGFGLDIRKYRGLRSVDHSGGDPGYVAYTLRLPDQGLALAILCNIDSVGDVVALAHGVADAYLPDSPGAPSPGRPVAAPSRATLTTRELAGLAGLYRNSSDGNFLRVFVRDGKLLVRDGVDEGDGTELIPVSAGRAFVSGSSTSLDFVPGATGRLQEIHIARAGMKPLVLQRLGDSRAPWVLDLRAFAGDYTSQEIDARYTLAVRDSALAIQIPGRADIIVKPVSVDSFVGGLVGLVQFFRDAGGTVTGFSLSTPGVRSLPFNRVKA